MLNLKSVGAEPTGPSTDPAEGLLNPAETFESVSAKIGGIVLERKHPPFWWISFGIAFLLLMGLLYGITILFAYGVGIWGINIPVAWGFAIVNFVWWIGIGHAGTLISAILLLLLQKWRNSINRLAEAMTLFAVGCAGMFPLLHLGRPWAFYWILPYPNTMGLWPQFRSALVWDVFAVGTYFTVSLLFWYTGLVPDLSTMRDRAKTRFSQIIFGILSLGWRGSAIHWKNYQTIYLILAGLSTPLVLSVHSVVSFDFSTAIVPGWHTTIFPPYFVAGAVYSGFAMVLNILIPVRYFYRLDELVTPRHLNCMANVMLTTGLMVVYGYIMETFTSWYSGDIFEQYQVINRTIGPYGPIYWALILFNVLIPQLLWSKRIRTNPVSLFLVALSVNLGMWLERFVIVIVSLHRDFLPSSWGIFAPTGWDWLILSGSLGLFCSLIFLFIRFLPLISIFEVREIIASRREGAA
ncbi:MAG: polysulfide reductase NrfD [Verrucomicrobia bacterium]|nr:polysulfide reductase NrfD [Verrucomicrobiota bacterium]